jgi:glycosyltransferase involved in cell wall biosynthesis
MRIAITSDLYYPMTNGVAVFAHNLAKGLAKQGHEVLVLCPSFTGRQHREKREGVTTFYLRSIRFPFYPDQINEVPEGKEFLGMPLPRLAYRHGLWITVDPYPTMKKVLNRFRPDVIHNQTAEVIAFAARRYAKKYDVPMVSTGHAYPDNITSQLKILKPIKRPLDAILRTYMASFLKHSEYATMPTKMAIDDLVPKKRKHFKVPVEPLSNGVDLAKFGPGKAPDRIYRKYHLPKDKPLVLYVGRVDPEKSLSNVVSAFAGVLDVIPEAKLVIVGDGTDRRHLQDLAQALGIEKSVYFPGRIYPPDIMEVYRAATLFATASETETQGIVLIEAAATGLPLVAVDAGAVRELCQHKRNGILCHPGDVAEMTDAMMKLLKNPELCERYGKESLEVAKMHDLNRTLQRFVEIYQEAIQLKRDKID